MDKVELSVYFRTNVHSTHCRACKRSWEQVAIATITNSDHFQRVAGEVYDCQNLEVMYERGDRFFGMLPLIP